MLDQKYSVDEKFSVERRPSPECQLHNQTPQNNPAESKIMIPVYDKTDGVEFTVITQRAGCLPHSVVSEQPLDSNDAPSSWQDDNQ